jgi:hypothetical protein
MENPAPSTGSLSRSSKRADHNQESHLRLSNCQIIDPSSKGQLPQTLVNCLKRKLQPELDKAWVTKTASNLSKSVGRIVPP